MLSCGPPSFPSRIASGARPVKVGVNEGPPRPSSAQIGADDQLRLDEVDQAVGHRREVEDHGGYLCASPNQGAGRSGPRAGRGAAGATSARAGGACGGAGEGGGARRSPRSRRSAAPARGGERSAGAGPRRRAGVRRLGVLVARTRRMADRCARDAAQFAAGGLASGGSTARGRGCAASARRRACGLDRLRRRVPSPRRAAAAGRAPSTCGSGGSSVGAGTGRSVRGVSASTCGGTGGRLSVLARLAPGLRRRGIERHRLVRVTAAEAAAARAAGRGGALSGQRCEVPRPASCDAAPRGPARRSRAAAPVELEDRRLRPVVRERELVDVVVEARRRVAELRQRRSRRARTQLDARAAARAAPASSPSSRRRERLERALDSPHDAGDGASGRRSSAPAASLARAGRRSVGIAEATSRPQARTSPARARSRRETRRGRRCSRYASIANATSIGSPHPGAGHERRLSGSFAEPRPADEQCRRRRGRPPEARASSIAARRPSRVARSASIVVGGERRAVEDEQLVRSGRLAQPAPRRPLAGSIPPVPTTAPSARQRQVALPALVLELDVLDRDRVRAGVEIGQRLELRYPARGARRTGAPAAPPRSGARSRSPCAALASDVEASRSCSTCAAFAHSSKSRVEGDAALQRDRLVLRAAEPLEDDRVAALLVLDHVGGALERADLADRRRPATCSGRSRRGTGTSCTGRSG